MKIRKLAEGVYTVKSDSKNTYYLDTHCQTCNCKSWIMKTKRPCKHLLAIRDIIMEFNKNEMLTILEALRERQKLLKINLTKDIHIDVLIERLEKELVNYL